MNILVIDVGTSSMKCLLYGKDDGCIWKKSEAYSLNENGEAVEIEASVVIGAMLRLLSALGIWCQDSNTVIDTVSLTSQRSSVVPVAGDGKTLSPVMSWQDNRAQNICERLEPFNDRIHAICGMVPTPVYSAPKIAWFKENKPELYKKAERIVGFYELLAFHLTGEWMTDDSVASRSCLFSLDTGVWSKELVELFGIDEGKLCDIYPVGYCNFHLKPEMQSLLSQPEAVAFVLAGGDQQCAAAGSGCISPDDLQINTGTGGYALGVMTAGYPRDILSVVYNRSVVAPYLVAEASTKYCGNVLERIFSLYHPGRQGKAEFDAMAALAPPGAEGCILEPELIGDSRYFTEEQLKGEWSVWACRFGENNVRRAVLEGIARNLSSCVASVRQACGGGNRDRIVCGGGLTHSEIFCRILADALKCTLLVPAHKDITALGALSVARRALQGDHRVREPRYMAYEPGNKN